MNALLGPHTSYQIEKTSKFMFHYWVCFWLCSAKLHFLGLDFGSVQHSLQVYVNNKAELTSDGWSKLQWIATPFSPSKHL